MLYAAPRTFADRHAAGRALARRLMPLAGEDPVVIGLARGGMPVAYEVANALGAPLDVLVVRKIGAPGNPEFGIGAVAEGGVRVLNEQAVRRLGVSHEELDAAIARAEDEIDARVARYRGRRPGTEIAGRTAIVVDDGLASGGTARAAVRAVRARGARRVVLAVPVGAPDVVAALRAEADDVHCVLEPEALWAVGAWYQDFGPTDDSEVLGLLAGVPPEAPVRGAGGEDVGIPLREGEVIVGDLTIPDDVSGLVIFAHGSGSSRHSPRNRYVAAALNEHGLATLLLDLLTPAEELERANVFDVPLLAGRLVAATRWARAHARLRDLAVGYFGASTGAAAALWAAAELGHGVAAVVSRGGRPDLAAPRLAGVRSPTLLIVGGEDRVVLRLNEWAKAQMLADTDLSIVPGATHLFEEPGTLEEVARRAGGWFVRHFAADARKERQWTRSSSV